MYKYCKYYMFIFRKHILVNAPNFYYTTTNCNPPTDFHSRNYPIIISRYLPIYLIIISSFNNYHLDRGFSLYSEMVKIAVKARDTTDAACILLTVRWPREGWVYKQCVV